MDRFSRACVPRLLRNADIGIDPDTKRIAWAQLRNGVCLEIGTIPRRTAAGVFIPTYEAALIAFFQRCALIRATVWIENVFLGMHNNPSAVARLGEVQGELLFAARLCQVPIEDAQRPLQQTWRSKITMVKRGGDHAKAELKMALSLGANVLTGSKRDATLTEHEAAAVCIGMYGNLIRQNLISAPVKKQRRKTAKTRIVEDL